MKRYHYIDDQGNISDALPLAALLKIGLPPATKVLLEGGKQWISLAEASENGPKISPLTPPPIAATSNGTASNVSAQSSKQYPCPHCKNAISVEAKICGHCQKKTPLGRRTPGMVRMFCGVMFIVAGINAVFDPPWQKSMAIENVEQSNRNGVTYPIIVGAVFFFFGFKARKEHKEALAAINLIRAG